MTRKRGMNFEQLNFRHINREGKYSALCMICKKELCTTAIARLKIHRNLCKNEDVVNSGTITSRSRSSEQKVQMRRHSPDDYISSSTSISNESIQYDDESSDQADDPQPVCFVDINVPAGFAKPNENGRAIVLDEIRAVTNNTDDLSGFRNENDNTILMNEIPTVTNTDDLADFRNENDNVILMNEIPTITDTDDLADLQLTSYSNIANIVTESYAETLLRLESNVSVGSTPKPVQPSKNKSQRNLRQTLLAPLTPPASRSSLRPTSSVESLNVNFSDASSGSTSFSLPSPHSISSSSTTSASLSEIYFSSPASMNKSKSKTKKSTAFCDNITKDEIEKINIALSEMLFACNIPFSVANSSAFENFIKVIRPAYVKHIPDRRKISSEYLNKVYDKCVEENAKKTSKDSVLIIDGWKNSTKNSKNVVRLIQDPAHGSAFLDSWDFSDRPESAAALEMVVQEAKDLAKSLYGTNIYAVVSDNAANMVSMGTNIQEWHSTCNSHTANLLAKDLIDTEMNDNVTMLLKIFKRPEFEKKLLSLKGTRVKLPCETRWCSYRDSYISFLKNLTSLRLIVADSESPLSQKLTREQKLLLADDVFIQKIRDVVACMEPICRIVNISQKFSSTIADSCELWLNFEHDLHSMPIAEEQKNFFQQKFEKRRDMALNVYALAANYLHPKYHENWADSIERSGGKSTTITLWRRTRYLPVMTNFLISNLNNDGLNSLGDFRRNLGIFRSLKEKNLTNPISYWDFVSDHQSHKALSS